MLLGEIIPSHELAVWLLDKISRIFEALGLPGHTVLFEAVYAVVVGVVAWLMGWILQRLVLGVSNQIAKHHPGPVISDMLHQRILLRASRIIPPLVALALLPFAFRRGLESIRIIEKALVIYTMIMVAIALNAVLTLIWNRYDARQNKRNLPLKGVLNTAHGIVWAMVTILAIAYLIDKSPAYLLTGLGAFAAALMLIFKDTILGFVAGLQLSQNDMVRVGDWIVVPSTPANGVVRDMSLSTVKVENWDHTIVTLPPYTLVSGPLQNYRGMYDAGCRQISRRVIFDIDSVKPLTPDETTAIADSLPLLKPFVAKAKAGEPDFDPGQAVVNGTVDTNLGLLRAYLCLYILGNSSFDHDQQVLVRLTEPTAEGYGLEIYCFTSTTAWTAYEAIQSALFEHIASVAPQFGLTLYNAPAGEDLREIGETSVQSR